MIDVVVVSVPKTKNLYYLSPNSLELKKGDNVVFKTENGLFLGKVVKETYSEDKKNLDLPLDKVVRKAIDEDYEKESKNEFRYEFCRCLLFFG